MHKTWLPCGVCLVSQLPLSLRLGTEAQSEPCVTMPTLEDSPSQLQMLPMALGYHVAHDKHGPKEEPRLEFEQQGQPAGTTSVVTQYELAQNERKELSYLCADIISTIQCITHANKINTTLFRRFSMVYLQLGGHFRRSWHEISVCTQYQNLPKLVQWETS